MDEFYIGAWRVEPQRLTISNDRTSVTIKPRSMEVLVELARAEGNVVSRQTLIDRVWGDAIVTDDVLTQCIVELRRALGDDARSPRYIETIKRVGIRLIPAQQPPANTVPRTIGGRRWAVIVLAILVTTAAAIFWLLRVPPLPDEYSIAVLPFTNMTPDPENQYFGDGLAEEVLNSLTQIKQLRVVARTSSFAIRDQRLTIGEIGDQLDVAHVLEGSVRRSGNHIRVTAQLIDSADGYHRWSRTYDYDMGDIFQIQQKIAMDLVTALALDFGTAPVVTTTNGRAYGLLLAGKQHLRAGRYSAARKVLRQAIREDPDYGLAHANLAMAMTFSHENATSVRQSGDDFNIWILQAEQEAQQAMALAPGHEDVYIAQASIASARRDPVAEAEALEQAIALNPASVEARIRLSRNLASRGQFRKALEEMEAIENLDPLNPSLVAQQANLLSMLESYESAVNHIRRLIDLELASPLLWATLTELAAEFGRYTDRVKYARNLVRSLPGAAWPKAELGDAYTELGELELADNWISAAEKISRLEAIKARARWLGASGEFDELERMTAALMTEHHVDEASILTPVQSAIMGLRAISLSLVDKHALSADKFRAIIASSSTISRRVPHMPVYARVLLAQQLVATGDRKDADAVLADIQRRCAALREDGITEYPWLTLLQASTYALAGDTEAAEQWFSWAVGQGWRAWVLERFATAKPLENHQQIVRLLENDIARDRQEVRNLSMAKTVDEFESKL